MTSYTGTGILNSLVIDGDELIIKEKSTPGQAME